MFKKDFKIKNNTPIKGSERKHLKEQIIRTFPKLTSIDVDLIMPKKAQICLISVITASGDFVQVITFQKCPLFFEYKSRLFPTLYLLWKYPYSEVLPNFTTHPQVLKNITSGADLMMPGVVLPPMKRFGNFPASSPAYVTLSNNEAAVAVGVTALSSLDMMQALGRGKCVIIYHSYGDKLCTLDHMDLLPLPELGPPGWLKYDRRPSDFPELIPGAPGNPSGTDFPPLGAAPSRVRGCQPPSSTIARRIDFSDVVAGTSKDAKDTKDMSFPALGTRKFSTNDFSSWEFFEDGDDGEDDEEEEEEEEEEGACALVPKAEQPQEQTGAESKVVTDASDPVQAMDDLVNYCFFLVIKYSKTLELPMLTSTFFKMQMIPNCPDGKQLDLKKSSFKKLKVFLDSMAKDGLIMTKEIKKGVETITAINRDHYKYHGFYVDPALRPLEKLEEKARMLTCSMVENYMITQCVLPIFQGSGFRAGDMVPVPEIRRQVTEYIRRYNYQDPNNKEYIAPKGIIAGICGTEDNVHWNELLEKVLLAMKACYKVKTATEELMSKGNVTPITLLVANRSGNKKVTLVDNLEPFGIKIHDFAKECQHGVAASTSITRQPNRKYEQLMIQGNQVIFVHKLLTEKYKIPERFVKGLENAAKKKK